MASRWAYPAKRNVVAPAELCNGRLELLSIGSLDDITCLNNVEKAMVARVPLQKLKTLLLECDPIEQMEMMRALPGGIMAKTLIRLVCAGGFLIIDHEAREVISLVASVCPSIHLSLPSHLNHLTYDLDFLQVGLPSLVCTFQSGQRTEKSRRRK